MGVVINPVTRSWRNEVIDHVFNAREAGTIKSIPLSSTNQPDQLIWHFTPSGHYSVKSGYRFLHENSKKFQSSTHDTVFWKKVWGMEVPSKKKKLYMESQQRSIACQKESVPEEDYTGRSVRNLQGEDRRLLTCTLLLF